MRRGDLASSGRCKIAFDATVLASMPKSPKDPVQRNRFGNYLKARNGTSSPTWYPPSLPLAPPAPPARPNDPLRSRGASGRTPNRLATGATELLPRRPRCDLYIRDGQLRAVAE